MARKSEPKPVSDAHTSQPRLAGRRALITGGTTGIGRAIAVLLAAEGVRVFVCGRTPAHLKDALARINEVGQGSGINVDLAKRRGVERFFDAAQSYLGTIDIAVINAAIPAGAVADTEADDLDYQLAVDFASYVTTTSAAVARLGEGGDLILIGSMSAVSRMPGSSVYVAAKAGVQALAETLRKELAEKDVKVGLIEPGFTGADFQYPDFPPAKQRKLIKEDRMLRAEDIAVAAHFMLSQPRRAAVSLIRVETRREHP